MENSQDPDPELFGQKGTIDMLLTLTKRAHAFVSVIRHAYFLSAVLVQSGFRILSSMLF